MIDARCVGDLEAGAEIGGGKFGDQFLEGVGVIAETAEIAGQAMVGTAPMTLMPISA